MPAFALRTTTLPLLVAVPSPPSPATSAPPVFTVLRPAYIEARRRPRRTCAAAHGDRDRASPCRPSPRQSQSAARRVPPWLRRCARAQRQAGPTAPAAPASAVRSIVTLATRRRRCPRRPRWSSAPPVFTVLRTGGERHRCRPRRSCRCLPSSRHGAARATRRRAGANQQRATRALRRDVPVLNTSMPLRPAVPASARADNSSAAAATWPCLSPRRNESTAPPVFDAVRACPPRRGIAPP